MNENLSLYETALIETSIAAYIEELQIMLHLIQVMLQRIYERRINNMR